MVVIKLLIIVMVLQNTIAKPIEMDVVSEDVAIDGGMIDEAMVFDGDVINDEDPIDQKTSQAPKKDDFSACSIKEHVYYKISNTQGGNLASNPASPSEIIITPETASDYGKWLLVKIQTEDGTRHIFVNKYTKTALTLDQETFQLQTPVQTSNQIFDVIPTAFENACSFWITNHQTNDGIDTEYRMLTMASTMEANASLVVTMGTSNEVGLGSSTWQLVEYPCDPVPNQPYSLVHVESGVPAGIIDYSIRNQVRLRLAEQLSRSDAQIRSEPWNQFEFVSTDGLYKIYNKYQGGLGIYASEDGSTILGDKRKGERFITEQTSQGYCVISESVSDRAVEGIPIENGYEEASLIQLKAKNGLANQQWKLEPYEQPIVNQYLPYRIKNRATGKVLESGQPSHVIVNEFDQKKTNQIFYFDISIEAFDHFYIRANESGRVLDAEFSQLLHWRLENKPYQRMKLVGVEIFPEKAKYFKIVPESQPDKCLIAQSDDRIGLGGLESVDHFGHWEFILATTDQHEAE